MKEQEKKKFTCEECSLTFQHRTSLARHRQVGHGPSQIFAWCVRCPFKSTRKDNLRRHYRQNHEAHIHEVDLLPLETERERAQRRRSEEGEKAVKETRRMVVKRTEGRKVKDLGDAETWAEALRILHQEDDVDEQPRGEKRPTQSEPEAQEEPPAKRKSAKQSTITQGGPLDLSISGPEASGGLSLSPASLSLLEEDVPAPVRKPLGGKPRGMLLIAQQDHVDSSEEEAEELQQHEAAEAAPNNGAAAHIREDLRPIHVTSLEEVLRGRVTRVKEVSTTLEYKEGVKVREQRLERVYDVQFDQDFRKK
ncbi:uncharacterized protein LOC119721092 [Patiria miniata]|uniref:C2H2-type domain-containing protein n=1 Tax=Patiria miniata TaxID=46514 RepID=A0A913Z508_PATMI|nr:uncharacterized protein LOC119721092 [Patiria miniata]